MSLGSGIPPKSVDEWGNIAVKRLEASNAVLLQPGGDLV